MNWMKSYFVKSLLALKICETVQTLGDEYQAGKISAGTQGRRII